MAQAVVDPVELRRFARNLREFNAELQKQSAVLMSQLANLNSTWRDQEQRKFSEQFEEQMRAIGRLCEANDQYIPYLLRKAEHIEEYLQSG